MSTEVELRDALVDLAVAAEYFAELEGSCFPLRDALDRAWRLVDSDGALRERLERDAGCVDCGAPFDHHDPAGAELCSLCAVDLPEEP